MLLPGRHLWRIERPALDALIEKFRAAHFFGLERKYAAKITDNPTYVLRFETGGRSATVTDYVGEEAGMPAVVKQLEDAVDATAGTARWVSGDESTVAALQAEGFDFGSGEAADLAAAAAIWKDAPDALLVGLLEAGVSADRPLVVKGETRPVPLGETLLLASISNHRPRLFAWLAQKGWLDRVSRQQLSIAFAEGGGGCEPAVARALVAAGADPTARTTRTTGSSQEAGASALMAALAWNGPCYGLDVTPLIAELVSLGVDVKAVDDKGRNALYGVADPDLLDRLLAAGVPADVHDKHGNSPIFSAWNERIVLGLLDAGADPGGRYSDGKTLRQRARNMPSVLAWLDAKGVD